MKTTKQVLSICAISSALVLGSIILCAGAPKKGAKAAGGDTAAGKKIFAASCTGCHAIAGKGGKMGPDLSHVGKKRNAAWLSAEIRNPKKNKPKGIMTAFNEKSIDAKQLKALVAYLGTLK